jgi:carboxypeptidase PM20D1
MINPVILLSLSLATISAFAVFNAVTYGAPQPKSGDFEQLVNIDEAAAAKNLADAIKIKTISHSVSAETERAAFLQFHDFLRERFPLVHENLSVEVVDEFSLLYKWQGSSNTQRPALFSAHMDVVPVEDETVGDWDHPPFAGTIVDGNVWGRGALDMKTSLVAYMVATEALLESGFQPSRTIYFAFTHDEEIGAQAAKAIATLLSKRSVELEFTLDEGLVITNGMVPGIEKPVALIGTAEKGYVTLEITGRDKGGHGSIPHRNTLNERLGRALIAVMDAPFEADLKQPAELLFEYVGQDLPFANRLILANRWLTEPLLIRKLAASPTTNALIRTTVAPTMMESGFKTNALPQTGRVVLNIRILPGETYQGVRNRLIEVIGDASLDVRVTANEPSDPSAISDVSSESFLQLRTALHEVFPDVLSAPALLIGRTDSRRYAEISEQSYRFLPSRLSSNDLARVHGTNERIAISNFIEIIRFYARFIEISSSQEIK